MITEDLIQEISESLYSAALRRVPPDTLRALENAREREEQESARATLDLMVRSARLAEENDKFVCSDSGVPTYVVEIGGSARWRGDIKAAERARGRLPEIMATLTQRRDAAESRN